MPAYYADIQGFSPRRYKDSKIQEDMQINMKKSQRAQTGEMLGREVRLNKSCEAD